jgi:hypothetical protein
VKEAVRHYCAMDDEDEEKAAEEEGDSEEDEEEGEGETIWAAEHEREEWEAELFGIPLWQDDLLGDELD